MALQSTEAGQVGALPAAPPSRNRGLLACGAASALWGTGFYFGKLALRELTVGHMVFYRFCFATLALAPLLFLLRPGFSAADWGNLAVTAFFGVPLQFLIQFHGLALTSLSHAALMVGTMPAILAAGAAVFLHERLRLRGWLAIAGSTAGASLIAFGSAGRGTGTEQSTLAGDALVVLSLALSLVWVIRSRHLTQRHPPLQVSAWTIALGTAMLAVWTLLRDGMPPVAGCSHTTWMALAASGVLCTAATTTLWNWGLTQAPASEAGVLLNLEPVIGSALGVLLFGDRLGVWGWAGGALIVTGAVLVSLQPASHPPALLGQPE